MGVHVPTESIAFDFFHAMCTAEAANPCVIQVPCIFKAFDKDERFSKPPHSL